MKVERIHPRGVLLETPRLGRFAVIALLLALPGSVAFTQDVAYQYQSPPSAQAPTQAELDQLLAPVALYPDALLGNILAASTYPLEVVSLARWLERNPNLSGAELEQAVAQQPWDASVKSLAAFRGVAAMMNGELDWMQRLGNAFLADQGALMDSVQRLRRKAREAGNLQDNERERVIDDRSVIVIEPAQPDVVYVPYYDPAVVYGPWWWPGYPPYAWGPYYFGPWDYFWGGIAFGAVWVGSGWHDHHPHPDWHGHQISHWSHDPSHRIGVPYTDSHSQQIYRPRDPMGIQGRQAYRGFDVHPGVQPPARSQPGNPIARLPSSPGYATPHALNPSANPIAREQSARGHESLASRPSAGNPIARAPSGGAPPHGGGAPSHASGGGKR